MSKYLCLRICNYQVANNLGIGKIVLVGCFLGDCLLVMSNAKLSQTAWTFTLSRFWHFSLLFLSTHKEGCSMSICSLYYALLIQKCCRISAWQCHDRLWWSIFRQPPWPILKDGVVMAFYGSLKWWTFRFPPWSTICNQ